MKNFPLILLTAAAGALTTAACTQDKKVETTTTTTTAPTAGDTAIVVNNADADYQDRADRIANRFANDMSLTDSVVVTKVRTVYYNRARNLGNLNQQYATDTAGRYAAARAVNVQADNDLRTALNSPDKYRQYETNRLNYADERYVSGDPEPVTVTTTTTTTAAPAPVSRVRTSGPRKAVKKLENDDDSHKVKYTDGSKRKVEKDGDIKIKRADGTKVKIDADGERTVKRF
ncbi:hypothetical protein SAMN02745146_2427 [Hymenobacter daecheongensis DSM 21074]|uniref:Uncharacterized protein n=1 Tax=Hymenobacter daecheongensis DSM 21074 TaxID=1121955 RepID=A0A1M6GX09_9BACT|nr:hypothetical protein [Hymenobacter daecheongensis]SHJ14450.1 hypothetical protein SAMN02745146_2427 [Hymenobacter daecheongensis DSM 21074]